MLNYVFPPLKSNFTPGSGIEPTKWIRTQIQQLKWMRILPDPIRIRNPVSNTVLSCLADCEVFTQLGWFLIILTALPSLRAKNLEQEQSRTLRYGNIYEWACLQFHRWHLSSGCKYWSRNSVAPGARAVITKYGSGAGSRSLLFYQRLF